MLALSEGLDISLNRLREVAEADLARNKEAFLETAARLGGPGRDPQQVIAEGKRRHPAPEDLIPTVRQLVDDLRQTVITRGIVSVPYDENCIVAETPPFLRYAFAMMYSSGPFETTAKESYYYVTPPERDWPPEKVEEWMTAFTYHSPSGAPASTRPGPATTCTACTPATPRRRSPKLSAPTPSPRAGPTIANR